MPEPLIVKDPNISEQIRRLAEVVANMHNIISIIIENGEDFLPGESIEEVTQAWLSSSPSFQELKEVLERMSDEELFSENIKRAIENNNPWPSSADPNLMKGSLLEKVGIFKTSEARRAKENVDKLLKSKPFTDEKREKTASAFSQLLEISNTIIGSIPGHESIQEIGSIVKILLDSHRG